MDVVTLSRLLGHATPSITLDQYGHALNDHKRASVEKLGDIYNTGYSPAPEVPEQDDEDESQDQGYNFNFKMRF